MQSHTLSFTDLLTFLFVPSVNISQFCAIVETEMRVLY